MGLNFMPFIAGIFTGIYANNKRFRDDVNKGVKQLFSYGIDIINNAGKTFGTAQNNGVRSDTGDVYINAGESGQPVPDLDE